MLADFKLTETRQSPLKDQYDEWLARVICYAFSVPASAFITQVNRATSQTLRTQAAQEGLVPQKAWVKQTLDRMVQACLKQPDLEFAWVGDDALDPLQQAQTIAILVNAGIKTRDEARAELGLAGAKGVTKFNANHDELGRFTTGDGAGGTSAGVQIADSGYSPTMTDAGGRSLSLRRKRTKSCARPYADLRRLHRSQSTRQSAEGVLWPIPDEYATGGNRRRQSGGPCREEGLQVAV